ncbi:AAA family ATPase [Corallococcus carmarthensis]|uniref:AAA family ATPase n=1 Tax=Corallococcus carmarthensis TaxID=2316728 RepID=UPI00148B9AE4|nr:AAA family ATPase [Corallococcus carmarthensis]NOK21264.1 AAA family ATPase [Corallococcus carmarthensis]
MLTSITVENFRGIERLHVEGLGRVNLIIGRNDSGKTALMEALMVARDPDHAANTLAGRQRHRNPDADISDFDEFWLPIFHRMDATRGFLIESTSTSAPPMQLSFRQWTADAPVLTGGVESSGEPATAWSLVGTVRRNNAETINRLNRTPEGVRLPLVLVFKHSAWITPGPAINSNDIRSFSRLKQQGRDGVVTELLRHVNEQVSGVELLAPTGNRVGVYVRMRRDGLIPILMMGEGLKRYFEFAVSFAASDVLAIYIDEIENGLHHSVLEPLWTWISKATQESTVQTFVTTHSEECVQAAARAFDAQNDDGLRVIRLDKQEHETKAVVYDRDLVEAAERMGVEIRG